MLRKTKPQISLLLAETLVFVRLIIEHDDCAPWPRQNREIGEELLGLRRMVEDARREHEIGSAELRDATPNRFLVDLPFEELDVRETTLRDALRRARETRAASIDSDDALEDGRKHIEQSPIARACIDRKGTIGKERSERHEISRQLRGELALFELILA